jgi:ABC-type transporter Mla maintaining outer membrane lipid asymmetry ATPase subunit MlaF
MPDAAAQLMVGPLFQRGAFFFSGGIEENVLRNIFSSKDLLREQVKVENEEG